MNHLNSQTKKEKANEPKSKTYTDKKKPTKKQLKHLEKVVEIGGCI